MINDLDKYIIANRVTDEANIILITYSTFVHMLRILMLTVNGYLSGDLTELTLKYNDLYENIYKGNI